MASCFNDERFVIIVMKNIKKTPKNINQTNIPCLETLKSVMSIQHVSYVRPTPLYRLRIKKHLDIY